MYPHRIRLRGPWECAPPGTTELRVTLPCRLRDVGLAGVGGAVRFVRKFGYPGKADPETEHIWLVCDGCTGLISVRLNDHLLAENPGKAFAFDVTDIMAQRNRLEVLVDAESDQAGLWGEVALEIRKDAYLADIEARREGEIVRLTGRAVGTSARPLELYVIVAGRHVDYRTITPTPTGTPFQIAWTEASPASQSVRVELIDVSTIWYIAEAVAIRA